MKNPASLKLYREIVRSIGKLPKQTQNYYWVFTREHFVGHRNEINAQRIEFLVEKGYDSLKYIVKKYTNQ